MSVLNRYYPRLAQLVIDELIEAIMVGLQVNEVKYNQRRIAQVKYLGDLYVYRMIDTACVFDNMYKILGFGYGESLVQQFDQVKLTFRRVGYAERGCLEFPGSATRFLSDPLDLHSSRDLCAVSAKEEASFLHHRASSQNYTKHF